MLGWNSLESVQRIHGALELAAIILFGVLVLVDILEHVEKEPENQGRLKVLGFWVFAFAVLAELIAYPYSRRADTLSNEQIRSDEQVVSNLNGEVITAKDNADKAALDAAKAKADAAGVKVSVADALKLAKQVELTIAWRHLSRSQIDKIKKAIPPSLLGMKIEVHHLISDREAQGYADEIASALRPQLNVSGTSGYLSPWGKIPTGVAIFLARPDIPGGAALQQVLKAGDIDARWGLLSAWQISSATGIVIFVWPKPK